MTILQIEHPVSDFENWKAAFDGGERRRQAGRVRRYQVYRPINDPAFIAVDLEFDTRDDAERFELGLQDIWRSPEAARVLGGTPRSRIVEVVEQKVLDRPAAT